MIFQMYMFMEKNCSIEEFIYHGVICLVSSAFAFTSALLPPQKVEPNCSALSALP